MSRKATAVNSFFADDFCSIKDTRQCNAVSVDLDSTKPCCLLLTLFGKPVQTLQNDFSENFTERIYNADWPEAFYFVIIRLVGFFEYTDTGILPSCWKIAQRNT